ncbi:VOC family protein [Streptomyces sp. NPDC093591]|uniref:VOC family protein n=1 Tax=Streptomyces sp. NPDC093591 TaxID=3366044 RepID=UPI00381BD9EB
MAPPLGDSAHIGHAQLFTPDLDASVAFFTDYLGLTVNGQDGDTVYLRTFDDYEQRRLGLHRVRPRGTVVHGLHRRRRTARFEAGGSQRQRSRAHRCALIGVRHMYR